MKAKDGTCTRPVAVLNKSFGSSPKVELPIALYDQSMIACAVLLVKGNEERGRQANNSA